MKTLIKSLLFLILICSPVLAQTVSPNTASIACVNITDAGAFCNNTDATNLTGTVASARLSGAYSGITGLGTLATGAVPTTLLTGVVAPAQLSAATLTGAKFTTSTVTGLPTCNSGTTGATYIVTDALLPVSLAIVATGGAVVVRVYCNGTNWIVG